MPAAHVFCALAAGDSVKDAELRGWSDQLATCHTITSRDTAGHKLTHLSSQIEKTTVIAIGNFNSYSFIDFDAYMGVMCSTTAPVYFLVQSANNVTVTLHYFSALLYTAILDKKRTVNTANDVIGNSCTDVRGRGHDETSDDTRTRHQELHISFGIKFHWTLHYIFKCPRYFVVALYDKV